MEEPGRLQSMGSRRVGHDRATSLSLFTFTQWRRQWQPTPVFLPGESQGRGSLVGCRLWGRTESATTEATQQQQQQQQHASHFASWPGAHVSLCVLSCWWLLKSELFQDLGACVLWECDALTNEVEPLRLSQVHKWWHFHLCYKFWASGIFLIIEKESLQDGP